MSFAGKPPIILHADQEHSGIRLVIFLALFAGYFIGFQIVALLLQTFAPPSLTDYTTFLACVGAVPIALLIIWGLERVLKRVWHSGLSITLDEQGLYVHDRRNGAAENQSPAGPTMTWTANMSQLNWYFRLSGYPRGGRERRIPVKWHCLASELQQDELRLSIFAFMPPDEAAAWTENPKQGFHIINPAEIYDNSVRSRIGPPSRPTIPNRLLQSKDGRYWLAERRRWEYGIELSAEDFATLMGYAANAGQSQPVSTQSES
jgi:hypothetical protein